MTIRGYYLAGQKAVGFKVLRGKKKKKRLPNKDTLLKKSPSEMRDKEFPDK